MYTDILRKLGLLIVLVLVQALVLNHVRLFGCATPMLCVMMVIFFQRNYPKWAIMAWSFALGLSLDTFSNTPGMSAASMTLVGCLQPYMLEAFIQRENDEDLVPSMRSLGVLKYICYSLLLVFIYCVAFYSLEAFSFFNWRSWLMCIGGSTLITVLLLWVMETIRKR
ncbi:MAG: rod shape-determining protein MreD [Prevotella sp.]|nr:rod shape-determining protein MreD [Prevotella sp.]